MLKCTDVRSKKRLCTPKLDSLKLRITAQLPSFVDQRLIGINLNRVNLLCRLGGIKHLRVEGITDQGTSSYVPAIVGYDARGNAHAGKTGLKTSVPTYTVDSQSDDDKCFLGSRWVNGVVNINIDETRNQISTETKWKKGVHSSDAWSYHLNKIIKGGLLDIGIRHLILDATVRDYLIEMIPIIDMCRGPLLTKNLIWTYGFWYVWANIVGPSIMGLNIRNHRHSLMLLGPQLDRALLLKLISLKSTLVKSLPDSEIH